MLYWSQIQAFLSPSFIVLFCLLPQFAISAIRFGVLSAISAPGASERAGLLSQCGLWEDTHM